MTNANSNEVSNELNYWAKMEICHLPFAMQDLARFCLGDYIAAGMSRMVFDWKFTPSFARLRIVNLIGMSILFGKL